MKKSTHKPTPISVLSPALAATALSALLLLAPESAKCEQARPNKTAIATAKLIIEYNSTDEDLGVHGSFDDSGWSELQVFDPHDRLVLSVNPQNQLKRLTMAGIFFESREPAIEQFSFADLKARFPAGKYRVRARSFDGTLLTGAATFTHEVPQPPIVTAPLDEAIVSPIGLVVEWMPVTMTIENKPLNLTGYQVIITKVEHTDPHGFSRPVFDVHLPANRLSITVPDEFLEPGTLYELEVLAIEVSGNQTITVSFFTTQ